MTYSLNEIDALCRKAARGAGYEWGLAEEAGHAARWLERHGCLGAQTLAALLETVDGQDLSQMTPQTGPVWQAAMPLCPVITGAALCDFATLLGDGPITIGPVRFPLILLPFAAMAAGQGWLSVTWEDAQAFVGPGGVVISGNLGAPEAGRVTVTQAAPPATPVQSAEYTRSALPSALYARLSRFAQRTYAPATEASRIAGAGAGLTDND